MPRRLLLSASALCVFAIPACAQSGTDAKPVSESAKVAATVETASRDQIEAVVREYILENPEIVSDALDILLERQKLEASRKLANDPRDFSIGPKDARVTVVEFFDYRCGFCKASLDYVLALQEEHGDDVRIVFKEFPILSAESREAAYAALAAQKQGKYLEMHTALMKSKTSLSDEDIDRIAKSAGVNVERMRKDMKSDEVIKHLSDVRVQAGSNGAEATPTFYINGEQVSGFDKPKIEALLEEKLG